MKCSKCGKEIDENDKFCTYCGNENKLEDEENGNGFDDTKFKDVLIYRLNNFILAITVYSD